MLNVNWSLILHKPRMAIGLWKTVAYWNFILQFNGLAGTVDIWNLKVKLMYPD